MLDSDLLVLVPDVDFTPQITFAGLVSPDLDPGSIDDHVSALFLSSLVVAVRITLSCYKT